MSNNLKIALASAAAVVTMGAAGAALADCPCDANGNPLVSNSNGNYNNPNTQTYTNVYPTISPVVKSDSDSNANSTSGAASKSSAGVDNSGNSSSAAKIGDISSGSTLAVGDGSLSPKSSSNATGVVGATISPTVTTDTTVKPVTNVAASASPTAIAKPTATATAAATNAGVVSPTASSAGSFGNALNNITRILNLTLPNVAAPNHMTASMPNFIPLGGGVVSVGAGADGTPQPAGCMGIAAHIDKSLDRQYYVVNRSETGAQNANSTFSEECGQVTKDVTQTVEDAKVDVAAVEQEKTPCELEVFIVTSRRYAGNPDAATKAYNSLKEACPKPQQPPADNTVIVLTQKDYKSGAGHKHFIKPTCLSAIKTAELACAADPATEKSLQSIRPGTAFAGAKAAGPANH